KIYNEKVLPNVPRVQTVAERPPKSLDIPGWFKQFWIYTQRDFWAKISNTQYIALNILEAPVLGFILAYLIRYIVDPDSDVYIFRENANIPIYIFMGTVVAIFFGLIISAEEIFKDAKILKRERFLNLSRSAYLMSKIFILMGISAIQMVLFVLVGNWEISFTGMNFQFWLMLFTVAVSSDILGLIISSTFNSIVTIYIMIPLIMIPQMVLGGAMFTFDKLNKDISAVDKVPLVAEIIPARYAYEGLIVYQYKNNDFEKAFFDDELLERQADFKTVYYLPKIKDVLDAAQAARKKPETLDAQQYATDLALVRNELGKETRRVPSIKFDSLEQVTEAGFNDGVYQAAADYIAQLDEFYQAQFMKSNAARERKITYYLEHQKEVYNALKNACYNEAVSDVVTKTFDKNKILRDGDRLIQIKDPIYQVPEPEGILRFRSQFFSPYKYFFGTYIETIWFNILAVWIISAALYAILYYDLTRRAFEKVADLHIGKRLAPAAQALKSLAARIKALKP
ncbi:ABC transporter permease, partial [Salmonella enterica]|nr:ABC transporter permease [Salmonella enterica]